MNEPKFYKFTMDLIKYDQITSPVELVFATNSHLFNKENFTVELFEPKIPDLKNPIIIFLKTNHIGFLKTFSNSISVEPEKVEGNLDLRNFRKSLGSSPKKED